MVREITIRKYTVRNILGSLTALSLVACIATTPSVVHPGVATDGMVQQMSSGVTPLATPAANNTVPLPTRSAPRTRVSEAISTAVPTQVISSTRTPAPTLTPAEGVRLVKELLSTNGNCDLPCWWGIQPGEALTPGNVDLALGMPHHRITDDLLDFAVDFADNNAVAGFDYQVSVATVLTSGTVSEIRVSAETIAAKPSAGFAKDWQALALHRVLTKFGKPSEVRLASNEVAPELGSPLLFSLDVIYADKGIAIQYNGGLQRRAGRYLVCPSLSGVTSINLLLAAPGNETGFGDQLRGWSYMNIGYTSPIQDVSTMTVDSFYTLLRDSPVACFSPTKN